MERVIQVKLIVPDDIHTGLITGKYAINGSVVRIADGPHKGAIVKHLDSVDIKKIQHAETAVRKSLSSQKVFSKAGRLIRNRNVQIIAAGAAITGGAWVAYHYYSKAKYKKVVKRFQKTLTNYLDQAKCANLQTETINEMISSIEEMKMLDNYEKIRIQLTVDQVEVLTNRIREYTIILANENKVELQDDERRVYSDPMEDLEHCLHIQKRIFEA